MMKYKELHEASLYYKYSDIIVTWSVDTKGCYILNIRDQYDFKIINKYKLNNDEYSEKYLTDKIILFDKDKNSIIIDLHDYSSSAIAGPLIPTYFWDDATLWYDNTNKKYKVMEEGNVLYEYKWNPKLGLKYLPAGILETYSKGSTNNYVQLRDYRTGRIKWERYFDWSINRVELYRDLIILDYWLDEKEGLSDEKESRLVNPNPTTVVIDSKSGTQAWWNKNLGLNRINFKDGLILSGGDSIREVEIESGNIINCVEAKPKIRGGYYIYHSDEEGYYYKSYKQYFGKIRKIDGVIEWEYTIIDKQNNILTIFDWAVLGNGKLVLKVDEGTDENPVYIFDPEENLEYSNVKDGKRIREY